MKKRFIALLLAMLMIFSCLVGCGQAKQETSAEADAEETFELPPIEDERTGWEVYDRVYASHDLDTVVMHINGVDVTWGQYYYMLFQEVRMLAYYLGNWEWKDLADGERDYETIVKQDIEAALAQYTIIWQKAKEEGVTLSEESVKAVDEAYEKNRQEMGEGDDAKFIEALKELYLTPEIFRWAVETTQLYYTDLFNHFFGYKGADFSDEAVEEYIDSAEYLRCKHILLMTIDPATRASLSEDEVAAKKATAEDVLAQLKAVENDKDKLQELFAQLITEYNEDPGVLTNPNGYYFQPGMMVQEFEDATKALEDYGLSDIVETSYGYHIILRLPISADDFVTEDSTMRQEAAGASYDAMTDDWFQGYKVEYEPEFADLDFSTLFAQG